MRSRISRQLGPLFYSEDDAHRLASGLREIKNVSGSELLLPQEFSNRDYAVMLLHVGAEIEHALMVEYLYAGYSLGGPGVPEPYREMVRGWQEVILGIAKEEMGHLISVQN